MQLAQFTFNPFSQNTFLLHHKQDCVIIDPGNSNKIEDETLFTFLEENKLTVSNIYLTHSHIDHILGIKSVLDKFNCPVHLHPLDIPIWQIAEKTANMYGIFYNPSFCDTVSIESPQSLSMLESTIEIRLVPGHSPGHVVFINHEQKWVIAGDALFNGSIGRTDLPFGNHNQLIENIHSQLFTLPNDYTVYCGHGLSTTIGSERNSNPFLT